MLQPLLQGHLLLLKPAPERMRSEKKLFAEKETEQLQEAADKEAILAEQDST